MLKTVAVVLAFACPALVCAGLPASAPRPAITGISHLTLFADNIAKSQIFYTSLLGWVQVPAAPAKSGVRFYANHAQYVELVSPPSPGLADRLDMVAFATSDAEALRKYLAANHVAVPDAVTVENDGSRSFLVRDPEGNKVGFVQDGNAWTGGAKVRRQQCQLTHHACRLCSSQPHGC